MVSKSQKYITESYCAQVFSMQEIILYQTTASGEDSQPQRLEHSTAEVMIALQLFA